LFGRKEKDKRKVKPKQKGKTHNELTQSFLHYGPATCKTIAVAIVKIELAKPEPVAFLTGNRVEARCGHVVGDFSTPTLPHWRDLAPAPVALEEQVLLKGLLGTRGTYSYATAGEGDVVGGAFPAGRTKPTKVQPTLRGRQGGDGTHRGLWSHQL